MGVSGRLDRIFHLSASQMRLERPFVSLWACRRSKTRRPPHSTASLRTERAWSGSLVQCELGGIASQRRLMGQLSSGFWAATMPEELSRFPDIVGHESFVSHLVWALVRRRTEDISTTAGTSCMLRLSHVGVEDSALRRRLAKLSDVWWRQFNEHLGPEDTNSEWVERELSCMREAAFFSRACAGSVVGRRSNSAPQ